MRGKFWYIDPKKLTFFIKMMSSADKMPSKFKNRLLKTLFEIKIRTWFPQQDFY